MKLYMIIAERDLVYPECIFVSKSREKAEQKLKEIAGMHEIEESKNVKYVHKPVGYTYETYALISKTLD